MTTPYDVLTELSRDGRVPSASQRERSNLDGTRLRELSWRDVPHLAEALSGTVGAHCGIDDGFIVRRVTRPPLDPKVEPMIARIENAGQAGREVQLRDIRI